MGWQDRNYDQGNFSASQYFGNPLAILNYSLPVGNWFGVPVRLHFFLLLAFLFNFIQYGIQAHDPYWALVICVLELVALLCHEFGHRFFARRVDGDHNYFVLWPAGGMVPPTAPPLPGATFIAHVGGIAVNALLALASAIAIFALTHRLDMIPHNPFAFLLGWLPAGQGLDSSLLMYLSLFTAINLGIIVVNLLPYYWFDGAYILQSILWPFTKLYNAINITCIVGMVLAISLFALALLGTDIVAMIIIALLFASSYTRRKQLQATGTGEFDESIAWSANAGYTDAPPARRRKLKKRWFNDVRKKARAEQAEQARIDAILAKVKEKGLHSLTYFEKRALKKATERQRQRDLANR